MFTQSLPRRRLRLLLALELTATLVGGCGGDGGGGMGGPGPTPADTTAPTVSVAAASGAVSRSATLTASATDDRGVTTVEFLVDGAVVGTDTSAPFSVSWDSSSVADGSHAVTARAADAAGNSAVSSPVTYVVRNNVTFALRLSPAQEFPATGSTASGDATLNVNLATGAASGGLIVTGMTATAAHIHDGFAGISGPVVIGLAERSGTPGAWDLPANTILSADQVDMLLAAQLYLNVHSAGFPGGEVRGQIVPDNVSVFFTDLSSNQEIEPVQQWGRGRAALTVNRDTRATVAHVWLENPGSTTAAHLSLGEAGVRGASVLELVQDTTNASHWSTQAGNLTQAALDALLAGGVYFGVNTDANPNGAVRGQVVPPNVTVAFARLEGLQEVPDVDSTATGTGAVTINRTTGLATIHVTTRGLENAVAAHLHTGAAGVTGPPTIGLTQDGGNPNHWFATGQPISATDLAALDTGGTYLNVHTQAHQGGEIRGQVVPPDVLFIATRLSGAQEVPTLSSAGKGVATVTVQRATRNAVLNLNTSGVDDAVGAHMHRAFAGMNGPIAVGLGKEAADPKRWSASGVQLTDDQLGDLEHGEMYVNVHTPAHPGGEIRGQLVPDDIRVVFTSMSGAEEVPAVATTATGFAATTVDLGARAVAIHVHTTGVDNATASHIHGAARGTSGAVLIGLAKDANDPGHWSTEAQSVTDAQIADFLNGLWYVNVHTPAYPAGEVRGQIVLPTLPTSPPADTAAPTVVLAAQPATVSGTLTLAATATDNVGVTGVRFFVNGNSIGTDATAPYSVPWNTTTVADGQVTLTAEASDAAGNVGQSAPVTVTVSNGVAVTLTQLQSTIFGPRCSGCHTGGGVGLPSSMNLSSRAATYAALVNVGSVQQAGVLRVMPGNASASYLVRKLEGDASISGVRMPQGGPYLSAAEIDLIKQWINAGAPDN